MHQTAALIQTLKKVLKANGKTYADVARVLALSEISVKRLFATKAFSLVRLERVCLMMDLEMHELFEMMEVQRHNISSLTREQEALIVSDIKLLLIAICVLNRYTMEDIMARYKVSEIECISRLTKLDKMGLSELQPRNRVKLLMAADFSWLPGGPNKQFFEQRAQKEFLSVDFTMENDTLICLNAMLGKVSLGRITRKLEDLRADFAQISQEDTHLPVVDRQWTTLVLAMRPWEPSLFDALRRQ